MMRKLYDMATATEKTLCRTLVLSAALMAGCISGNGTGDTTDANVEAEDIAKTLTSWLEPYQARSEVAMMQDGGTTYLYGSFGALQSVFSTFQMTFAVDAEEREVVCYGYLPTMVPEDRRREMVEFIFRGEWEYGISTASMVLEDDGHVRCQAWTPFESFALQPQETQWRLLGAVVDKLWSFSEGVAAVSVGCDPAEAAANIYRTNAFEGRGEASEQKDDVAADTQAILGRCFDEDADIIVEEADDPWICTLSGKDGDVKVGIINARFEEVVRDVGGRYDVLPYSLVVRDGMVWNICNVPEVCPDKILNETASILMGMNQQFKYGLFGIDFDTGKIWCHYELPVSVIPDINERPPKNLYCAYIKTIPIQIVAQNSEALHSEMVKAFLEVERYEEQE